VAVENYGICTTGAVPRTIRTVLFAWRLVHPQLIVPLHPVIVHRIDDFLSFLLHPADILKADNPQFSRKLLDVSSRQRAIGKTRAWQGDCFVDRSGNVLPHTH
jgi:hypothetical protein